MEACSFLNVIRRVGQKSYIWKIDKDEYSQITIKKVTHRWATLKISRSILLYLNKFPLITPCSYLNVDKVNACRQIIRR